MRLALPKFVRHPRLLVATIVAIVIAASTTFAQLGTFDPAFDGELWGVRHELVPANDGAPAGVVFVNGTLFVVDSENDTVVAYDAAGNVVPKPDAEWDAAGMELYAAGAAVVNVDGADTDAILISDEKTNRVAAFDTNGAHLFTLRPQRPATESPLNWLTMGQPAMSPGAKFIIDPDTHALTLTGTFAVGWYEGVIAGSVDSGAMVFPASTTFFDNGTEFEATPAHILRGTENNPVAPDAQRVFGVTFDSAGNLYMLDWWSASERLNVYGPDFTRLFTFGTPIAGGGTSDFYEPWGIAYWPDANGGRILIADTYNSRILVYRPTDTPASDPGIDTLVLESTIRGFVAPIPKISLFSIAVDPTSGSIAVSDFADWDDGGHPRAVVLQQPNLAAFNLQVLDANNAVVQSVCAGADYKVRFSLTVPAGRAAVNNVAPQLSLDGVATSASPVGDTGYPSPLTLSAGQVATFTYGLTAGTTLADIQLLASASGDTSDVLGRAGLIFLADCANDTDASVIEATPNIPPQVSGWTPVYENQSYSVTLSAHDLDGIGTIEYQITGANQTADEPTEEEFDGEQTAASIVIPMPEFGRSTLSYRMRDGNGIWSPLQTLKVRPKLVVNRSTNESGNAEFRVGDPEGVGFTYSVTGLPPGATFATNTGQFSGVISFDAANPYSSDPILQTGVYPVVVTETAPDGATSSVAFTWTINHVNRPPIITNQPIEAGSLSIIQGAEFSLKIDGMDPDGDPAVFALFGRGVNDGHVLPATITINPATGQISGTFPLDADAAYDFSVSLAECGVRTPEPPCNVDPLPGARQATYYDFQLAVLDLNLPADIVNPGPKSNAEGDIIELAIQASDPDGDVLSFDAGTTLPPGLSIDTATGTIRGVLTYNSAGTYAVTVNANDHINPKRSETFSWVVANTNRPPTASALPRFDDEDQTVSFSIESNDPDLDPLTFSATGLPPGISINPTTGVISGHLPFNSAGLHNVVVTVSDGTATATAPFPWTVRNVNAPPVITNPGDRVNDEGNTVSVPVVATDVDGDALTFSATGLPPGLSIDPSTGIVSGVLPFTSAGPYVVTVTVSDGTNVRSVTFNWTVKNVNRPPVVTNPGNQSSAEGQVISLPVLATDPDLDALTYSATGLPPGLSIDPATGVISGTIAYTASVPGIYTVNVTASDGSLSDSTTFTWTVSNVNRPPTVTAPDRTNAENDSVSYATDASDPDGDALTYTATGLPAGITINPTTGAITGTLGYDTAGTYNVTITVTDAALTASAPFVWTVTDSNAAPVITSPGDLVNDEGQTINRQITASDADSGDTLTFSATGLPPGLSISASGLITGTLPFTSAGIYPVVVTVSDGTTTRSVEFKWTVNNINRPPDVINPGTQSTLEGAIVVKPIAASDPDLQALTYSATGLPPGLSINPQTGVISGTIGFTTLPSYLVTVTASDGALSDSETFMWNIVNVNRAPQANDDAATVTQGQSVVVDVRSNDSDADGQTLTVTNVTTPSSGTVVISGAGTVTYTAASSFVGTATFYYTISDGLASATAKVTVTVLSANQPPVCTAAAVSPGSLWPPNHKPVYLSLSGITDPEGRDLTIKFTSVMQDEETNTTGDGNTTQDAGIEDNGTKVWVRAERRGDETAAYYGRVYIVGFTATDDKGASCTGTVFVGVPHDQGNHNQPIPSTGRWNSITGALILAPAPNANADSVTVKKNTTQVVAVQANDVVYGAVVMTISSPPASGIAVANANGTVTYTPAANFTGKTSFTYRLANGQGFDTAVVSVTVKK